MAKSESQLLDLLIVNPGLQIELETEWTSAIQIRERQFIPVIRDYHPGSNPDKFIILTESNAHAILNHYSIDCYVIFLRKDNTYHLLAKKNSEIQQFNIFSRITTQNYRRHPEFNLKDEKANWLFEEGVRADNLYEFLDILTLQERFPRQLKLSKIKALSRLSSALTLENYTIKEQVLNNPSLLWVQNFPVKIQEKAILYFINIFIEEVNSSNIHSFINKIFQGRKLSYRKYYCPKKIEDNLTKLRELSNHGNLTASLVLACILFSGLREYEEPNPVEFYSLFSAKEKAVLFRDLEEYKEVIENCSDLKKVYRDLFLLQYYQQKGDKEGLASLLKNMDVCLLIKVDRTIFSDHQFIKYFNRLNMEPLKSTPTILHQLMALDRIILVNELKDKLPKEVFQVKNEEGENILHVLANYITKNGMTRSTYSLGLFKFICERFPHLLAEMDMEGNTVYDKISPAINKLRASGMDKGCNSLNSLIAKYPPPSQELDNQSYRP